MHCSRREIDQGIGSDRNHPNRSDRKDAVLGNQLVDPVQSFAGETRDVFSPQLMAD